MLGESWKVGTERGNVRVVVPLPGELGLEVTARGQGLAGLDDIEVLGVNVAVLGLVEVLLCYENTLCAEESVWLLHSVAAPGLDKSVEDQKRKTYRGRGTRE